MASKRRITYKLNQSNPSSEFSLDWEANTLYIFNATKFVVFVSVGTVSKASKQNFSDIVAPYSTATIDPAGARDFYVTVDNSTDMASAFPYPVSVTFSTGSTTAQAALSAGIINPGLSSPYLAKVQQTETANLVDFWSLNDQAGTAATDLIAAARSGTYVHSPTLAHDVFADGVNLTPLFASGSSQFVSLPFAAVDAVLNRSEGTFLVWVKIALTDWNAATPLMFFELYTDVNNYIQVFKNGANNLTWFYNHGGVSSSVAKSSVSNVNWLPIALTWSVSNNRIRAYYAGVQEGSDQALSGAFSGALTFAALAAQAHSSQFFVNGNEAMCALWTKELSAGEVSSISIAP